MWKSEKRANTAEINVVMYALLQIFLCISKADHQIAFWSEKNRNVSWKNKHSSLNYLRHKMMTLKNVLYTSNNNVSLYHIHSRYVILLQNTISRYILVNYSLQHFFFHFISRSNKNCFPPKKLCLPISLSDILSLNNWSIASRYLDALFVSNAPTDNFNCSQYNTTESFDMMNFSCISTLNLQNFLFFHYK